MRASHFLTALALIALGPLALAAPTQGQATLKFKGTTQITAAPPSGTTDIGLEYRPSPEFDASFERLAKGSLAEARVPSSHVPTPADTPIAAGAGTAAGFDGLTVLEQRLADNGNQFTSEPPDQALAVGGGYVLEAVNTALRVRTLNGGTALATVSLNKFFGLHSAIVRSTPPVYGEFTSDPKAYYDADTQRWFVTMLEIDQDPATGDFLPHSSVLIAVSQTSSPLGAWFIYSLDTTNATGTPEHAGCPCLGDQPLIGADRYGFYVSTNEFPLFNSGFNGAQVYAISKAQLVAGTANHVVTFSGLPLAEGPAYSLQPAITAQGGAHESARGGTEYFLSALDFNGTLDNRIAVWALTNTQSLDSAAPSVALVSRVLDSQVYGQPPVATQRPGPTPLADKIKAGVFGKAPAQNLPLVDSNDDRMQQVTWANGKLWSSLNTVVKPANGTVRTGAAYFAVAPSWSGAALGGAIVKQGIVSISNNSLLFPSVGMNRYGKGVMSFSVIGDDVYPSVAYVKLDDSPTSGTGAIHFAAFGAGPDDGFSGYAFFGGRVGRWGDYSAAVADADGNIWFANEYIPNLPRATLANWGTYIARVVP